MYVFDGSSKRIVTDITYHEVDVHFVLVRRHENEVIGITVEICCGDKAVLYCLFDSVIGT